MSDFNREFELEMWEKSLCFGVTKGSSITTNYTIRDINQKTNQNEGDSKDAVLGRIIKRTSATQK